MIITMQEKSITCGLYYKGLTVGNMNNHKPCSSYRNIYNPKVISEPRSRDILNLRDIFFVLDASTWVSRLVEQDEMHYLVKTQKEL
jgi:hypothetical protein